MKRKYLIVVGVMTAVLLAGGVLFSGSRFNIFPQLFASWTASAEHAPFPDIKTEGLSEAQKKIVAVAKKEYAAQPDATKYSESEKQPWCANFVSWVYREAGVPLKNPNSGSWRLPGTYTLRDYYEAEGRFKPAQSGYNPKVGDVLLYDNPSTFGQHTNIVIKYENGRVTTVGSNEPGGIRVLEYSAQNSAGFVGYGVLQ